MVVVAVRMVVKMVEVMNCVLHSKPLTPCSALSSHLSAQMKHVWYKL